MQNVKKVQNCAQALKTLLPSSFSPVLGFVLGTGLGSLATALVDPTKVPYSALPDMPPSTVASHQGAFVAGTLAGVPVLLQQGRSHLYEGRSPGEVAMGVRVMACLGIKGMVITNAAGAINPGFRTGSLMAITDHINMTGMSPLRGDNADAWGTRFPDMSRAYDPALLGLAERRALNLGLRLERGVYLCAPGPQLETPAETRAYRLLGGDAVGMSTVMEVIAARHLNLPVLGISCLTNQNLPDCMAPSSIEEIIRVAEGAGTDLARLLTAAAPDLAGAL